MSEDRQRNRPVRLLALVNHPVLAVKKTETRKTGRVRLGTCGRQHRNGRRQRTCHRRFGQQPFRPNPTPVHPQGEKASVVARRRVEGGRTEKKGKERRIVSVPVFVPECRCTGVVGADLRARRPVRAQHAIGVLHAERFQDAFANEFLSRLSGDLGDNRSERFAVTIAVGKHAGFPRGTRLARLIRDGPLAAIRAQLLVDEREGETTGVSQQLFDGDLRDFALSNEERYLLARSVSASLPSSMSI